MSQNACEVLYVKYNSARRPEFRVTTEICEGPEGRFVRKRAGAPAAVAHLNNIHQNALDLRDYYSGISIIDSQLCDETLRFPYVTGQTLAEQIDVRHFDRARFVEQVGAKLDAVLDVQPQYRAPFESTEGFEAVFGRVELDGVPALNPANIDSLLTNFIENNGGICCIDCEWVCRFPVPVDYIRYRILRYFYLNQVQSLLEGASLEDMLGWFGISGETLETFWQMERRFQQYIHGEDWKYIYTEHYKKKNVSIEYFDREIQDREAEIAAKSRIIQEKDVHIGNLETSSRAKDTHIENLEANAVALNKAISDKESHIENLEANARALNKAISDKDTHIENLEDNARALKKAISDKDTHINNLTQNYLAVTNSIFWRVTKPARATVDLLKRLVKKNESLYLFLRMAKDSVQHDPQYARERRRVYLENKDRIREANSWPSEEERARQSRETFPKDITFSILVPLYNTPEPFLRQMIQSVREQTYAKWELCLADGSDVEHASVGQYCKEAARKDRRIKYKKLKKNAGISGNTNACIEMATGDYIALFDHDDILHPSALYENMKVICAQDADFIYSDETTFHDEPSDAYWPHYKPDYAPDTLRSYNYICHLTVFKRALLDEIGGGFRSRFDGSQDYDMILRLTEKARRVVHIPKLLYYWRGHSGSVASDVSAKSYTVDAAKALLAEHLERVGLKGTVCDSTIPSTYKIQYDIQGTPLISIVIPNMDHVDDLKKCIDSIVEKSTWKRWEIIIVENNSREDATFEYYRALEKRPEIRVVNWEGGFNFSAICNFGVREARGDYILLLNNDIQVITPDWLEQMLMFAQRDDVGAVGAMLYYPDDTIQHAGVILGIGGVAGHSHKYFPRGDYGYASRLTIAQNLSGVTAACCIIPRRVWDQVGGLDEGFTVAFNDVDLCMRIRQAGYLIVWTPYAELYHFESKSRGLEDTPEKQMRFKGEIDRFYARWDDALKAGDPYYNRNLTLEREDFSVR